MGGVSEIAGTILARAFQRTEVAAQNMSNMTTPGYKARRWFPLAATVDSNGSSPNTGSMIDFAQGQLQNTGNPLDLALSGTGFFVVRSDDGTYYTRDGQFVRGSDGRIETSGGLALQAASGGDITVTSANPQILTDGTVLDGGQPVARVATAKFSDLSSLKPAGGGLFTASSDDSEDGNAQIHQGMLETSNVSTADEMISIMSALRSAESGQKVIQVYDDLMGRALNAFGQ
jgi:flagellar basal-body rod protein FlgF